MTTFKADTYVVVKSKEVDRPAWPAVVCADRSIPAVEHETRPAGFNVGVLLLQKLEYSWVLPSDMSDIFDSGCPDDAGSWEGLKEAFADVNVSLWNDFGADHWITIKATMENSDDSLLGTDSDSISIQSDYDVDQEMERAPKASLREQHKLKRSPSQPLLPLPRPLKRVATTAKPPLRSTSPDARHFGDSHSLPTPYPSPPSILGQRNKETESVRFSSVLHGAKRSKPKIFSGSPSNKKYTKSRLTSFYKRNADDEVDENGTPLRPRNWVEFRVGAEGKQFWVKHVTIKAKSYFAGPPVDYLVPRLGDQDNGWTLDRQALLRTIDPEDFALAAEYLLHGDFGHREIANDQQRSATFSQCVASWCVAENLGMADLMDFVVTKFKQAVPWELTEVLALARILYADEGDWLSAHRSLKDMIAGFIAEHYWQYFDEQPTNFKKLLKSRPALEADVLARRLEKLRLEADQGSGGADSE